MDQDRRRSQDEVKGHRKRKGLSSAPVFGIPRKKRALAVSWVSQSCITLECWRRAGKGVLLLLPGTRMQKMV